MRLLRDFLALTKPTISLLVVITGAAALVWERSLARDPLAFLGVLLGLFLASGCANGLNQYFERERDKLMTRTAKKRPLANGRLSPAAGLAFAVGCGVVGVSLFAVFYNLLSAALALATILFYAFFYTLYLKAATPQNIVIGGAAGAMGPVIAWAAAAGTLAWAPALMFLIIFFWTPPHFWALALCLQDDYKASNLPMMPNVVGEEATLRQMFAYSVVLVLTSLAMLFTEAGIVYMAVAAVTGALFLAKLAQSMRARTVKSYWGVFGYSIIYLFALFVAMMVDSAWSTPLL
ncbi:MAG: heme o synthase [Candidatus Sumerlaeia bacterium]|nr:heme o synthase [Candidatus Sumerlaeia bacterium]